MNLQRKNFSDLSEIKIDIFTAESKLLGYGEIMVIKYSGKYGFGSSGNSDAQYMYAIGKAALAAWEPMAVIIDFTDFSYEWGDMLEQVFDIGSDQYTSEPFPISLIVGPKCEEAIRTLLLGVDSEEPIDKFDWIFRDLTSAWDYVERKLEKPNNI